jgi:TctA family transporter
MFKFPRNVVLAGITIFSLVGAFAMRSNVFDVFLVVLFGIAGYFMEKAEIPLAPFILGLVLGPMIEDNLRIGLIKSDGRLLPFVSRPISAAFAVVFLLLFLYEPAKALIRTLGKGRKGA